MASSRKGSTKVRLSRLNSKMGKPAKPTCGTMKASVLSSAASGDRNSVKLRTHSTQKVR
jgi:hypothetical protein